ncbi:MAG: hypothetical protein PHU81_05550 [Acidobacteriota bacterium]|nr:hypothetical protein [Acidobacteriota bacterium]
MSKAIGNRQKPGWQRPRRAEVSNLKGLLKKFEPGKKNRLTRIKKGKEAGGS